MYSCSLSIRRVTILIVLFLISFFYMGSKYGSVQGPFLESPDNINGPGMPSSLT